jgi:VanZ family protein
MGFSQIRKLVASWKWVLGYTALLLLSLNQTRRFLDWLQDRNLSGLQGVFLLLAGIGCVLFLLRRIRQTGDGLSLSASLRLLGFLALYVFCMFASTNLTVDRIHFVEYGLLGLLCLRAVGPRYGPARRVAYGMVAVFAIGFLDEVVQGFLPIRYYALRDITIDLLAGLLPMLGLLWLPLYPGESQEGEGNETIRGGAAPKESLPSVRLRRADIVAVVISLFLVAGLLWVGRVPWDLEPLYGVWERRNACGRIERMRIDRDGTLLWEDAAGGRALGRYRINGNRLDGPLLEAEVLEGEGSDACAWKGGTRRDRYFEVVPGRLVFKKERDFPFRRIEPPPRSDP